MSRETLLDEAIAKAKEAEDWQLVEWLRLARGSESAARWYSDKLREAHRAERKLLTENEKLRELVRKVEHYEQLGCHDCPHGGSCAVDTLYDEGCAMSREIEFEKRKLGIEVDA